MRICDRTGETNVMSNGQVAEIIRYGRYSDIDVRFSDGYIAEHCTYDKFSSGHIRNPNLRAKPRRNPETSVKAAKTRLERLRRERIGESKQMANGLYAEIIEYKNSTNMFLRFEDGVEVFCNSYLRFQTGYVMHPDHKGVAAKKAKLRNSELRKGEKSVSKSTGLSMTITEYRSNTDIDVLFENGVLKKHIRYNNFVNGHVSPYSETKESIASRRVGMTCKANDGTVVTLIRYRNATDIDVRFEDGSEKSHVTMAAFRDGVLCNPKISKVGSWKELIGTTVRSNCGLDMTLIGGSTSHDITVRFEDGTILEHRMIRYFKNRSIMHPGLKNSDFHGYKILGKSFTMNDGRVFYKAVSPSGEIGIWTPQLMMDKRKR